MLLKPPPSLSRLDQGRALREGAIARRCQGRPTNKGGGDQAHGERTPLPIRGPPLASVGPFGKGNHGFRVFRAFRGGPPRSSPPCLRGCVTCAGFPPSLGELQRASNVWKNKFSGLQRLENFLLRLPVVGQRLPHGPGHGWPDTGHVGDFCLGGLGQAAYGTEGLQEQGLPLLADAFHLVE